MPSISNGILYAEFTVGGKDASGNFTVSGTIYNTASNTNAVGTPRLSCSLDDSSNWKRISGPATLNHGASTSGSVSFSTGSTAAGVVYVYLISDVLSGIGGSYSVAEYTPPTPTFVKKTLYVSPATVTMGNTVSISESSGTGVSSVSRTWTAGGSSGSFSTGNWEVPISTFEPLCPDTKQLSVKFTTYSSGSGGSGSSSVTITANVPSNYLPTMDYNYEYLNARNNSLVAGISQLKLTAIPTVTPSDNSATVTAWSLTNVISTNTALTVSSFTVSNNIITSAVLPAMSNVPSYTFKLVFSVTDSRSNTVTVQTEDFKVSNFVPPYCNITDLRRTTSTTGILSVYINSPSAPTEARVYVGDGYTNVLSNITQVGTSDTYSLNFDILGYWQDSSIFVNGLSSGAQYNVTFTFRNQDMDDYGEATYSYSQLLSTLSMPLSLFDNGSRLAVSFGEECADNYGQNCVINFAKDSYIRYIRNDVAYVEKAENVFYSCPFPVNGIYLSMDSANPSTIWSGTTWSAIAEGRVLVGVGTGTDVNNNTMTIAGGDTGGEYTHQLLVDEMPSHTHEYYGGTSSSSGTYPTSSQSRLNVSRDTQPTGGSGYHNNVQPYLGVYIWKRTA